MITVSEDNFINDPKDLLKRMKSQESIKIKGTSGNLLLVNLDRIPSLEDLIDLQLVRETRNESTIGLDAYLKQ